MCERLHRSAPQNSSIQNAVKALDLHDPFLSHFCHCRRERNTHLNSLVIVYMEENHIKPLHTPRYNHALNKITARLPGPILRWVEASALARVVVPCSASLCPRDRCAVIHTFPVKPEPHHVLWAIFNAAVVTSARPIPQRLGQIWGMCGWVGVRRCLGIVGVIKLHFQAGEDGSISVDNKWSLALFGFDFFAKWFPQIEAVSFFLSCSLSPSRSDPVKYIKEMSAFFKSSGSPGGALPWDSPPSTPQRTSEPLPAEVKEPRSIPLKMCQVSRKQCPPDTENR